MAIIYTYPEINEVEGEDLLLISDTSLYKRPTRSVTIDNLATYIGTVIGIGFWNLGTGSGSTTGLISNPGGNSLNVASGEYSVATNYNNTASGRYSFVSGENNIVSGEASAAFGINNDVTGDWSMAIGRGVSASGDRSLAQGVASSANSDYSVALNFATTTNGIFSLATGRETTTTGANSISAGEQTQTYGTNSVAMGYFTKSYDYGSLVIGAFNLSGSTVTADRYNFNVANTAFVIGNGTSINARSDAFKVMFNGNTTVGNNLTLSSYGSGFKTGTATQRLAVDTNGNVIEIPVGSGPVDGSGTANYTARWTDSDTLGIGTLYDNGTDVGIGVTSPIAKLDITNAGLGLNVRSTQNTGIRVRGGANFQDIAQFQYSGGFNAMVLDSDGNLGVGETNPSFKLDVRSNGIAFNVVSVQNTAMKVQGGANGSDIAQFLNSAGSVAAVLNTNGRLGIGTTSPSYKLDVFGDIRTKNEFLWGNNNNSPVGRLYAGGQTAVLLNTSTDGFVQISGGNSTSNGGNIGLSGSTNADPNIIRFRIGGAEVMRVAANNNVGIGTTSPSQKLHVVGNARVTGAYYDSNNSPGTANQVLVSTATGTDWVDGSSSGIIGGPYLPLAGGTMSGNTNHSDNVKDRYGTGNDFQIWHDGSNTFLSNEGEGHLNIINTGDDRDIVFKTDDGSGATTSYMVIDGSAEQTRFYKDTRHTDGVVANFGNNNDLQIYHDGTNSRIYNDTGDLYIRNSSDNKNIYLQSDNGSGGISSYLTLDGSTNHAYFSNPGNVGIGTNNPSEKLDVRGNIHIEEAFPSIIFKKNNSGLQEYSIKNEGTFTIEKTTLDSGGSFIIKDENGRTPLDVSMGLLNPDTVISGDLFVKDKDGTNTRLYVNNGNGNVGIGTTSPSQKLEVAGNIQATGTGSISSSFDANHYMRIESNSSGGILKGTDSGVITTLVRTYGDSYFNGGNVGIGTTNPTAPLHILSADDAVIRLKSTDNKAYISLADNDTNGYISSENAKLSLGANAGVNASNLNIDLSNDNIGIGTASPSESLEISKSANHGIKLSRPSSGSNPGDVLMQVHSSGKFNLTADNDVAFTTGTSTDSFVIKANSGNVGIGTTNPTSALHVVGTQTYKGYVKFENTVHAIRLDLKSSSHTANIYMDGTGGVISGGGFIFNAPTARTHFMESGTPKMSIISGKVGIGTTSPSGQLEVRGTSLSDVVVKATSANSTSRVILENDARAFSLRINGDDKFRIKDETSDVDRLLIDSSGKVGIGTTAPTTKLQVNGDVRIFDENELYFGGTGSVPNWEIKASGTDLIINDTGTNVGSVLFNNDEGVVLPRLTTTEINAISLPNTGLTVYNTTLNTLCFYNGSSWQKVSHTNM